MTARRVYLDGMAATLAQWSGQMAELSARARSASAEQRAVIAGQMAALQHQWKAYERQMKDTRDTSAAVFRDMRNSADRMAVEFRKIYVQTASRFAS